MLPGIDGFAVLSALRTTKQTPVLMLTARGKTDDKVRGFDLGADDYLVKPFQFPGAARAGACAAQARAAGGRRPDPESRRSRDRSRAPPRHARGAAHRPDGQGVRPALACWPKRPAKCSRAPRSRRWSGISTSIRDSNVVEVAMRRLRAKIDDPFPDKLIHTVRGVGYVLEHRAPS